MLHSRFSRLVACCALVAVLTGCGDIHTETRHDGVHLHSRLPRRRSLRRVSSHPVISTTVDPNVRRLWDAAYVIGVAKSGAALPERPVERSTRVPGSGAVAVPGSGRAVIGGSGCFDQPYVPAWIVRRESGGDPTIINGGGHAGSPYMSGGRSWGCFQIMPTTWDASCRGLGFDVAGQAECARRISRDGTDLQPWAL